MQFQYQTLFWLCILIDIEILFHAVKSVILHLLIFQFEFSNFCQKLEKRKFASIFLTVRDRAILLKFSTHRVSEKCTLGNFQKIFPSPKMAAILNFRIFAKKDKTQICYYLLNRAR